MEIEFLILADAVEALQGKLYMLGGGWNIWRSQSYPAPVRIGVAISILVPWSETNERYQVRVGVVDADAHSVAPEIPAEFEVGRPPGMASGTIQRVLLAINVGFNLPKPGHYEVRANVGDSERTVSFDAVLVGHLPAR